MCDDDLSGDDIPQVPEITRRGLLMKLGVGLNVAAAALVSVPIVGYLFAGVRAQAEQAWVPLGELDDFPEDEVRLATFLNPFVVPWDGDTTKVPCWVRRKQGEEFTVFAINCAHLGCPVRWFAESQLFMCPCHGGVYYSDGSVASGPPPRGLFAYETKVEDKQLWVKGGYTPTLAQPLS